MGCTIPLQPQAVNSRQDITCLVQTASRKNSAVVLEALARTLARRQQAGKPPASAIFFAPKVKADMVHNVMDNASVDPTLINVVVDAGDGDQRSARPEQSSSCGGPSTKASACQC